LPPCWSGCLTSTRPISRFLAGRPHSGLAQGIAKARVALGGAPVLRQVVADILLERVPDLDAAYFSNDDMALGGYFHCLAHGIAVPRPASTEEGLATRSSPAGPIPVSRRASRKPA
jgi:hypothetical protein